MSNNSKCSSGFPIICTISRNLFGPLALHHAVGKTNTRVTES